MNYLLKIKILVIGLLLWAGHLFSQTTFINEIDYLTDLPDDPDQAVEIISPTSQDRTGWTVTTYNESGFPIESVDLGLFAPTSTSGTNDIIIVDVILFANPSGGISIQDATNSVVQFVNYGDMQLNSSGGLAQGGPAIGTAPTYTGVQIAGTSLQLTGAGTEYIDFGWQSLSPTTFGLVNTGQEFLGETFALPVELIHFDARLNQRNVDVNWSTSSEQNSFYYVLERSVNGAPFSEIFRTEAAGYSNQYLDYRFTDPNTPAGVLYYRLTEVDFDGMMTTFDVVAVTNKTDKSEPVIFPNPVHQELKVVLAEPLEYLKVEIFELVTGKLCHRQMIDQPDLQLTLDCSQLNSGQYLVRFRSKRYLYEQRFVKIGQ
jgi:hypothetical protein